MPAPLWLSEGFAAAMLATAAYCAGRLVAAGAWLREGELDADAAHLFMGVAMAGALAPPVRIVPSGTWRAVFAVTAGWFAWQAVRAWRGRGTGRWRCRQPLPHLAESLAMIYMLAAVPSGGGGGAGAGMPGMRAAYGMASLPVLAVIFALFMLGHLAWLADQLISVTSAGAAAGRCGPAAPATARGIPWLAGNADAIAAIATMGACGPAGDNDDGTASGPPHPPLARAGSGPPLAPRAALCAKIVMTVTMAYMLIVMV